MKGGRYLLLMFFFLIMVNGFCNITVTLTGYKFYPSQFMIQSGEKITFLLDASETHNVVSQSVPAGVAPFRSGEPGSITTWEYTPVVAGVYHVKCEPHSPGMDAVFTVTSPPIITITGIGPLTVCGGNTIAIAFTPQSSNVSMIEVILSGADGSFNNATKLEAGLENGVIQARIPPSNQSSNEYKLKLNLPGGEGIPFPGPIRIIRPPSVTILSLGGNEICSTSNATITASALLDDKMVDSPDVHYQWQVNGIVQQNHQQTHIFMPMAGENEISAIATFSGSTCPTTQNVITTAGLSILVNDTITPDIQLTYQTDQCIDPTFTISGITIGAGASPEFVWKTDLQSLVTTQNYLVTKRPGMINVTIASSLSCARRRYAIDTLDLTVFANPAPTLMTDTVCNGICLPRLMIRDAYDGGIFQWYRDQKLYATSDTPLLIPTVNGTFFAIQMSEACGNYTTNGINYTVLASTPLIDQIAVSIYPNPALSTLSIKSAIPQMKGMFDVLIINMQGHIAKSSHYDSKSACSSGKAFCTCTSSLQLDVSRLPTGMYEILIVKEREKYILGKFTKE